MSKVALLAALAMAIAVALPNGVKATSLDEVQKLIASGAGAGDLFGFSVAVSGDVALVGARDAGVIGAGAAYVFQRDQGGSEPWREVTTLVASDGLEEDRFGGSVAIDGDTAVVGALFEDTGGGGAGAAYVFQRDHGGEDNWGEVAKLTAPDARAFNFFGASVSISGDTIVVGAFGERVGSSSTGAAHVFGRHQGGTNNWGHVTKVVASDGRSGDLFGVSVALAGDTAVVGASEEHDAGTDAGAAYIFQRDRGGEDNWGEVRKLIASDARIRNFFGVSVAVGGDTAVVGALGHDGEGGYAGTVYIFGRDEGGQDNWGELKTLIPPVADAGRRFGNSVAVSGETVVVGAGGDLEAVGGERGGAYVFRRGESGGDAWGEVERLAPSDTQSDIRFGSSVAVSGNVAFVGALGDDGAGANTGAAYVFDLLLAKPPPDPGDASCDGVVNAVDATLVLQVVAGLLGDLPCEDGGDANADGVVDPLDAALILQFVAGLLESLPP